MSASIRKLYLLATIAVLAPSFARAQDGCATPTEGVAEVVVTAQRRAERLQDAPIAITAVDATALQARSVTSLTALATFAPNLSATTGSLGGNYANFFIRGVGEVSQTGASEAGVALYINGVYLARTNGADLANLDIARIEILRGPQGTLFGKNTAGGAINVITAQPSDAFGGAVSLTAGSRRLAEFKGHVTGPLAEGLNGRLSVNARTRDGYGRNIATGSRFGDDRTLNTRAALRWDPSAEVNVTLEGDITRSTGSSTLNQLAAVGDLGLYPAGYARNVITRGYRTHSGYNQDQTLEVGGVTLTGEWTITPAATLKSITAVRKLRHESGTDFDGGPDAVIDEGFYTRQHQISQELQLGGKALAGRLDWVAGAYYFREKDDQAIPLFAFTPVAINQVAAYRTRNVSAFAQGTYRLNDVLSLTAGVRYTHERKRQAAEGYLFTQRDVFYDLDIKTALNPPADLRGFVTLPYGVLRNSWESFTPRLTLDAKLTRDLLLYATVSEGFKSGGFNTPQSGNGRLASYDPETLTNYEVGLKAEGFDRRVRLNLAAFHVRYKDLQLYLVRTVNGALVIQTENAARARIYGAEGELTVIPVRGVQLDAAVGYLDTKYLELNANAMAAGIALSDPLPQAPEFSASLGGQYTYVMGSGATLVARLDYSYKSKYYFFAAANPLESQPVHAVLNARISYELPSGLRISAFAKNLTQTYYFNFRQDSLGVFDGANQWPAEPRNYGVQISRRF